MTERDDIKSKDPVILRESGTFQLHQCTNCGNIQRFPLTQRLVYDIECNECGKTHKITFILGPK